MLQENGYIHLFNLWSKVSYRKLCLLKKYFGSFERAWKIGKSSDFLRLDFKADELLELDLLRKSVDFGTETDSLLKRKIRMVGRNCLEYPFLLKQISSPPWLLYVRGASLKCELDDIAIVGTRMPSHYGINFAEKISEIIINSGGRIVSGLAFGVDACAHRIATSSVSPTVAVLASRVDAITPRSNTVLAERILETGGTIVSEYATATGSFKYRFRERNRIIAGMCRATIVIEAGEKSGALITAGHAFDQDRDVYALVGDINKPQAQGCLSLISRDIARPIINLQKLSEDLEFNINNDKRFGDYSDEVVVILDLLNARYGTEIDDLARGTEYDTATINMILLMMEMEGLVVGLNGKWRLSNKKPQKISSPK